MHPRFGSWVNPIMSELLHVLDANCELQTLDISEALAIYSVFVPVCFCEVKYILIWY